METGTILRTILVIATSLNTALMATDLTGFENEKVDFAYKIASIILNFIIVAIVTYFNNDFTEQGMIGTDVTRKLKSDPNIVVYVEDGDEEEVLGEEAEESGEEWNADEADEIIDPNEPEEGDANVVG